MQILKSEIEDFQIRYSNSLIEIGKAYFDGDDYRSLAMDFVEDYYAFDSEQVLFKPTFASIHPFRNDKLSALAYFIGGNPNFIEDAGFAIKEWLIIKFKNDEFLFKEDNSIVMGKAFLKDAENKEYSIEFTMGFILTDNQTIKLNLQHCSIPHLP